MLTCVERSTRPIHHTRIVREVKAFRVSSLSSAAEQRRFARRSCSGAQGTARGGRGRRGQTGGKGRSRKGETSQRGAYMNMTVGDSECAQNLCHEVCGVIIKLWNEDARAVLLHVRHASVEVQMQCVNVVIGVVLGELLVVRVVPVVVCDDAVVRRTLVLTAVYRSQCFHHSHFT